MSIWEKNTGIKTKSQIRKEVLALRDSLGEGERKKGEILVTERILGHQLFYSAESILAFAGCGSEISTSEIIKEALRLGKKVYLPKVQGENMSFFRIFSVEELAAGYRGIPEPAVDTEKYEYAEKAAERTLMIMPGVAFDAGRNRIGYGKGFYDKYLQDKEALQLRTIAIGFGCQMTDAIPAEENDIRPCQVICG